MGHPLETKPLEPGEIDELTRLLLGASREELWAAWAPADDAEFAERLTSSLAGAIDRIQDNADFRAAIGPVIVNGVLDTARRRPQQVGDALAPALGPAIRSLIKLSMDEINERIESGLQQTLSIEGLKWRWQAMRTGVSFSEVVLQKTRRFRVEHMMLIHRTSGSLLCDLARQDYAGKDASVVASMLTVVTEFIGEAFNDSAASSHRQIEVGGRVVKVEALGELVLAMVVRGAPTSHLDKQMRLTLEAVSAAFAGTAAEFRGDTQPFEAARNYLTECLIEQKLESRNTQSKQPRAMDWKRKYPRFAFIAALAVAIGVLQWDQDQRNALWAADLERINEIPGVVVLKVERTGTFWQTQRSVTGLHDPDAIHPSMVLEDSRGAVVWNLRRFLSLDTDVVLRRAMRLLQVPETVSLDLEGAVLKVAGVAPQDWIDSLKDKRIEGVQKISLEMLRSS